MDKKKRSPLQHLNVIPSSSISSSNSSSSSSSRTTVPKKPRVFSTHFRSNKLTKENDLPRPISRKPQKNPPFLSGNKPTSQKSNLYFKSKSVKNDCVKKSERIGGPKNVKSDSGYLSQMKKSAFGSERIGAKAKNIRNNSREHIQLLDLDLTSFEKNCTPVGKLSSSSSSGIDCKGENSNTSTKTPPIEASVSPDIIQCGLMKVSAETTPCYSAGHVLYGVTDKRKCRPRGILTIGGTVADSSECEKDRKSSRDSIIPLPAEASMHWLSSPSHEIREDGDSTLGHNGGKYGDSVNRGLVAPKGGKAWDVLLSPGSPEPKDSSDDKMDKCCCNDPDEWKCSCSLVRENYSPCSTDSLSTENIIQTPESELSSGKCGRFQFHSGDYGDNNIGPELDFVADFLDKTSLSPRIRPYLKSTTTTSTSWVSDSTLDNNVSQSQMRISWRDGIVSPIFEMDDDLDCCRCVSDDEENDLLPKNGLRSPEFLERKHELSQNAKLKSLGLCAESIRTEGGGVVSSADSDWTPLCYKNQLEHV